ncbi:hypothetical protein AGDE_12314 [Angomonas deanei]|uniref:Dpy-30 motif containing protein, putative n=1 Tax=Angomonas deanei TaxID=59799 RepID=A0A7G2CJQ9_9TRYP|nr:hypothetical protein AGDE_12314 [Angomonas deanei]CAD2219615.1 Dpy-30 motif containing protein, putative [Angomonas deanei]|eukprot:EPY24503.1 hypothetical protein AGDE_12314 [Angomonas deanei]
MSSNALSGTVSKVPFIVTPTAASSTDFIHFLKYKFYEKGFIIVREEYRLINPEVSEKLCVTLDYIPPYLQEAMTREGETENTNLPAVTSTDLIGTCYVFIVAQQNCHAKLLSFVTELYQSNEFTQLYRDASRTDEDGSQKRNKDSGASAPASRSSGLTLFVNRTAAGAQQAVMLLFPNMASDNIPNAVQSREYIQATLKNALLPALTELANNKPAEPIEWLANYLLERKYNAPQSS